MIVLGHSERSKVVVDAQQHAVPRGDVDRVAHVRVVVCLALHDAVPRTGRDGQSLRSPSAPDLSARMTPHARSLSGLGLFSAPFAIDLSFLLANRGLPARSFFELVLAERLARRTRSKNGSLHLPMQET